MTRLRGTCHVCLLSRGRERLCGAQKRGRPVLPSFCDCCVLPLENSPSWEKKSESGLHEPGIGESSSLWTASGLEESD